MAPKRSAGKAAQPAAKKGKPAAVAAEPAGAIVIKETLDQKIQSFSQQLKGKTINAAALRSYFTAGEMSGLWGRLKSLRGNSSQDVQSAWYGICAHGVRCSLI